MKNEKVCTDCKWFIDRTSLTNNRLDLSMVLYKICHNPKCMFEESIITGVDMDHNFCDAHVARTQYFNCGIDAKYFEPIE